MTRSLPRCSPTASGQMPPGYAMQGLCCADTRNAASRMQQYASELGFPSNTAISSRSATSNCTLAWFLGAVQSTVAYRCSARRHAPKPPSTIQSRPKTVFLADLRKPADACAVQTKRAFAHPEFSSCAHPVFSSSWGQHHAYSVYPLLSSLQLLQSPLAIDLTLL